MTELTKVARAELLFTPTFAELCDFLSIKILKSIFLVQNKKDFEEEIRLVMKDLELHIEKRGIKFSAEMIRALMILMFSNRFIWENENLARSGNEQDAKLLIISHKANGVRNLAKNVIANELGERVDLKTDSIKNDTLMDGKMDFTNLFFDI